MVASGPYKGVALVVLVDGKDRRTRHRSRSVSFAGSEDAEVTNLTYLHVKQQRTSEIPIWIFLS